MGGTLDISSFYYPLSYLQPCTFNIALSMRTRVSILPFKEGHIKISSKGFDSAEYAVSNMPFDHPLGLMFAIAAYFQIDGIHIHIESGSPPRSALGGSSVAAVALIAALGMLMQKSGRPAIARERIPLLAHAIEESVAGVPCGLQDQLAAFYGGVNAWYWKGVGESSFYIRKPVLPRERYRDLAGHLLVAYCGIPHESSNVNSQWVKQFIRGGLRRRWTEILDATKIFIESLACFDITSAVSQMNYETDIRIEMTPDVLDDTGLNLVSAARDYDCGARFTGAGGGGCIWALGACEQIIKLKSVWRTILDNTEAGALLDTAIDSDGLLTGSC